MEDNEIDLSCIGHSGDGERIVIFCSVNFDGRHIFGACILLEVDCDLETAG